MENKIHSSSISDPFYLRLAHVPGGNFFLWDFSLKEQQRIHYGKNFFACRIPLRMFTRLSSKPFVVQCPSTQRWKQSCMTVVMDSTTWRTDKLQRRNTASRKWRGVFASLIVETGFQWIFIQFLQITNRFLNSGCKGSIMGIHVVMPQIVFFPNDNHPLLMQEW